MIKNRNIAADANIDISKLNLVDGRRTFWEDFDDSGIAGTDFYGLQTKWSTEAHTDFTSQDGSTIKLGTKQNNAGIMLATTSTWTGSREPMIEVRFTTPANITGMDFQIGFAEKAAVSGGVADVYGGKDWGYLEFSTGGAGGSTSNKFVLRTRTEGSAAATVTNLNLKDVAASTTYVVSVKITADGGLVANVGDNGTFTADTGSVPSGNTDWQAFVRVGSRAAPGQATADLAVDTIKVSEARS